MQRKKTFNAFGTLKASLLSVLMSFCVIAAFAQSGTVKGTVTDDTGEPVIGANVVEKGSTNGTITDIDGNYTLQVTNMNGVLQFSFIGYNTTEENNILSRFFEGLGAADDPIAAIPVGICTLWGRALIAYGSAYDSVTSATNDLLSGLDSLGLGPVADSLRRAIGDIVGGLGFEPADMRLRKPVLTNSQNVLDKVGMESVSEARTLIERLPRTNDPVALARAVGAHVADSALTGKVTIAELPIPGTELTIPLTLDFDKLKGSS